MSEEIEVTINVTGEEAVKILNAKEQEITYLKNEIARLSQQTQHSEPQLTIPKSIADELEKVEMNWNTLKDEAQGWPTDDLIMWLDDGNNPLMFAYLAGKALGVDLVKVGEG